MATVTAKCPFCDGEFTLTTDAVIDGERVDGAALHTIPPCAVFLAEEPDAFARKAREAIEDRMKREAN